MGPRKTIPAPRSANSVYHDEHLLDRAAMLAMRAMMALQPAAEFGTEGRSAFDGLMEKTPAADGVTRQTATVGDIPGSWCRPANTVGGVAILYLHGGAYVLGSALAYRITVEQCHQMPPGGRALRRQPIASPARGHSKPIS
jgi:epsilon-lactone hydrolase